MKNSIFSIFAVLMVFTGLQTANAQTKATTNKEAQQLYQAVMENKAELEEQLRKGGVILEARKAGKDQQDGVAMPEAQGGNPSDIIIIDMVKSLEDIQDFSNRVEKTGGKMTAAQLAAFKAELAKFEADAAKIEGQTQSLTGTALTNCWNACKSVWPNWWQVLKRVACYAGCLLI